MLASTIAVSSLGQWTSSGVEYRESPASASRTWKDGSDDAHYPYVDVTRAREGDGPVGSMLGLFFCAETVKSFEDAKKSDLPLFSKFYQGMRRERVYIAPSQFEALFLSAAHTDAHIDATVTAAEKVLGRIGTAS